MQDEVKVSQADREAYLSMNTLLQKYRDDVMAGEWDSANGMQALARHRHQAERDTLARMEVVGWLYKKQGEEPQITTIRWRDIVDGKFVFGSGDWTETPLYALPTPPEAGQ